MTGLFNAGRQADALEVYARTRQVLADELGLDPSGSCAALMEQILRQDAAISPAAASPATVPGTATGRSGAGEPAAAADVVRRPGRRPGPGRWRRCDRPGW